MRSPVSAEISDKGGHLVIRRTTAGLGPDWIAARLSSAILADKDLFEDERIELLRLLVPVATPNATVLDRVLARLMIASRPDGPLLDALQEAAGPADIQHIAAWEGNLPS
jgi:hypothetical protein